jgi:hypothetical protein
MRLPPVGYANSSGRNSFHQTRFSTGEALGYEAKIRQHIAKLEKSIDRLGNYLTALEVPPQKFLLC